MKLIVGLGNPGTKYESTRHNIGFIVVEELAKKLIEGSVKWTEEKKFSSITCSLIPNIILVEPQTFMNGSGGPVTKLATFYKIKPQDIWIIHDDIDLPIGKLKIRFGGAAAGHHGVESITEQLGTDKFLRFRLGIGHPREKLGSEEYKGGRAKVEVENYVLKKFDSSETSEVKHMLKQTLLAIEVAMKDGVEKAMNQFNR
ncbi:MAG: aminoacyl-tRNA hydrolase [Candidatus Gottesmanbacteria bacterium]